MWVKLWFTRTVTRHRGVHGQSQRFQAQSTRTLTHTHTHTHIHTGHGPRVTWRIWLNCDPSTRRITSTPSLDKASGAAGALWSRYRPAEKPASSSTRHLTDKHNARRTRLSCSLTQLYDVCIPGRLFPTALISLKLFSFSFKPMLICFWSNKSDSEFCLCSL